MSEEAPLTLNDILTKSPDEIIKQITVRQTISEVPNSTLTKAELEEIKEKLKAFFLTEPDKLQRGQTLRVNSKYFIDVIDVSKTTNRAFFKPRFPPNSKTFSLAISYLVGQEFPYKVGDEVDFEGAKSPVISVSPSTQTITIKVNDEKIKLKIKDLLCLNLQ